MREFRDKVAVVTGGASGIGRAMAERFAVEGMRVVLADIEAPALDLAVAELRRDGHTAIGVVTDVSQRESVDNLARVTLATYGTVHLVCNNAGVLGFTDRPLWEATDKDWQWMFGVNLWGVVNGVRAFLPSMLHGAEEGYIVNTSSAAGLTHAGGLYGITKHAVVAVSEALYTDLKRAGARVGVSVLCPGGVRTRLADDYRNRPTALQNGQQAESDAAAEQERARRRERMAGYTPPADVAEVVIEAIRNEQLYVVTNNEWDAPIETRYRNILQRANPHVQPQRA